MLRHIAPLTLLVGVFSVTSQMAWAIALPKHTSLAGNAGGVPCRFMPSQARVPGR